MKKIFLVVFVILFCGLSFAQDEPLFEVKDGEVTIFSVTPSGITINGMKFKTVAEDNKLELYDANDKKLFYASPENARFIFHPTTDADRGGFAISTIASDDPTDEDGVNYIDLTPDNTFIGENAGFNNTEGTNNVFIGYASGFENIGVGGYTGDYNVFIGYESGMNNNITGESGQSNVFIGDACGKYNTSGRYNVFLGKETGMWSQTGNFNTYIGSQAGRGNLTGDGENNTCVGYMSGYKETASNNTYLGWWSAHEHTTGEGNTILGCKTGYSSVSGEQNTLLGHRAGYWNVSGAGNVFLGYQAGHAELGSNKLYIENSLSTTPLIYGEFDNDELVFNADVEITGTTTLNSDLSVAGSVNNGLSLSGTGSANGIKIGDDQTSSVTIYHNSTGLDLNAPGGRVYYGSFEYFEDGGSNECAFNSDLRPTQTDTYDLGTLSYKWQNVWATDGTINTSDIRDKENVTPVTYGINEIMQLNPVSFNWKGRNENKKKLGLIAQELLEVVPEVVKTHDEEIINEATGETQIIELERMGVYYSDLIPVLIKGMQDQQKMIDELNAKIIKLEEKLNN
jgi:Chaperone of endosialidase